MIRYNGERGTSGSAVFRFRLCSIPLPSQGTLSAWSLVLLACGNAGPVLFLQKHHLHHPHCFLLRLQWLFHAGKNSLTSKPTHLNIIFKQFSEEYNDAVFYFYFFKTMLSLQPLYDSFFLTFYNIFFTSWPILLFGLFEQNFSSRQLLENLHLYHDITNNARMSWLQFFKWTAIGDIFDGIGYNMINVD